MTIVDVKNKNYEITVEIGNVHIDPNPLNIYINYAGETQLRADLYIQFEDDRPSETRLLSFDVFSGSGLIKQISLIFCKTLQQERILNQAVTDKEPGVPVLSFSKNDKIISSGESDTSKQLYVTKIIECSFSENLFWIQFGARKLMREIVASDEISFYSDKENKLAAFSLKLEEHDKDMLKLWFYRESNQGIRCTNKMEVYRFESKF